MTYTYALLEVSPAAYEEIKTKLEAAGYVDQFHVEDGKIVIDMHGIALVAGPPPPKPLPACSCGVVGCDTWGSHSHMKWLQPEHGIGYWVFYQSNPDLIQTRPT